MPVVRNVLGDEDFAPQSSVNVPRGREMLNFIGTIAKIAVSNPLLNGRSFPVIGAYVEEDKFLLDATESNKPVCNWRVRYIKVSTEKIISFCDDFCGIHTRAVMLALNRDQAFTEAGLDVTKVWALDPRPEASVRPRCAFTDVPVLQERLNHTRAPGHPFQLAFGYFVFADIAPRDIRYGTQATALYSSEPIVLLKDCRGQLIDVSIDLEVVNNPTMPINPCKIFIEEPRLDYQAVGAGICALHNAREIGFLTGSTMEERLSEENPVELGMLPPEVDAIPADPRGFMVQIFKDAGLSGYERDKKKINSFTFMADHRRNANLQGSTVCSRTLFVKICLDAAPHYGQYVSVDGFGRLCFACYIRLDDSEIKVCGGCGKAVYCSVMCQNWHWKAHVAKCASSEERRARRQAAALAKEQRAAELARHDEMVALKRAEEAAKEAVRKHHAMVARAEKAEREEREYARLQEDKPTVPSDSGQSHRGRNKKKMHVMTVEQKLVHGRWTSEQERQARHEAATLRKQAAHLEAEARKAKKRVDDMKAKMSAALKQQAAAAHAVPERASVGDALGEALEDAVRCVAIE